MNSVAEDDEITLNSSSRRSKVNTKYGAHSVFFDTQQFIQLVEKQSCLWKYSNELFYDKEAKARAWRSIASDLYPDWNGCSEETKLDRG